MSSPTYIARRRELETYFDRTAADAWKRLTSDAPVSRVRATVRAGRDAMRATLLSWLPEDLRGARVLDAGCGTGALAIEAARRGADVLAIDISPTLVDLARERAPKDLGAGRVTFAVGDLLDPRSAISNMWSRWTASSIMTGRHRQDARGARATHIGVHGLHDSASNPRADRDARDRAILSQGQSVPGHRADFAG